MTPRGPFRIAGDSLRFLRDHPERSRIVAEPTGEVRPPRGGEWFLSGAVPEAYRAIGDLDRPYTILRLRVADAAAVRRSYAPGLH